MLSRALRNLESDLTPAMLEAKAKSTATAEAASKGGRRASSRVRITTDFLAVAAPVAGRKRKAKTELASAPATATATASSALPMDLVATPSAVTASSASSVSDAPTADIGRPSKRVRKPDASAGSKPTATSSVEADAGPNGSAAGSDDDSASKPKSKGSKASGKAKSKSKSKGKSRKTKSTASSADEEADNGTAEAAPEGKADNTLPRTRELELKSAGGAVKYVIGCDEAGRGPLAGPVVAAAYLMLDDRVVSGVNDSKTVAEPKREALYSQLTVGGAQSPHARWATCVVSHTEIDRINILQASLLGMRRCVAALIGTNDAEPANPELQVDYCPCNQKDADHDTDVNGSANGSASASGSSTVNGKTTAKPKSGSSNDSANGSASASGSGEVSIRGSECHVLVDGNKLPNLSFPAVTVAGEYMIGGDGKEYSIAAASVLAKVTRDRLMLKYHEQFPKYGFESHKGYGVPAHRAAIATHGPCAIHRWSYAPMKTRTDKPKHILEFEEAKRNAKAKAKETKKAAGKTAKASKTTVASASASAPSLSSSAAAAADPPAKGKANGKRKSAAKKAKTEEADD